MQVKSRAPGGERQGVAAQVTGQEEQTASRDLPWSEKFLDLCAGRGMDSAALISALRAETGERLRPDEALEGMFYAWTTGEAEPSEYYERLLGKVFDGSTATETHASVVEAEPGEDPGASELPWHRQMRTLRRSQGLSKSELVSALRSRSDRPLASDDEVMFTRVSRWESGKDVPSPFFQNLLSDVLGAPAAEFAPAAESTDGAGEGGAGQLLPPWSERVSTLRSEQGLSRADLVSSLRESAQSPLCSDEELYKRVAGWETGQQWPASYFCDLLGDVFKVPAAEFVNPTACPAQLDNPGLNDSHSHSQGTEVGDASEVVDDDEDGWEL